MYNVFCIRLTLYLTVGSWCISFQAEARDKYLSIEGGSLFNTSEAYLITIHQRQMN